MVCLHAPAYVCHGVCHGVCIAISGQYSIRVQLLAVLRLQLMTNIIRRLEHSYVLLQQAQLGISDSENDACTSARKLQQCQLSRVL